MKWIKYEPNSRIPLKGDSQDIIIQFGECLNVFFSKGRTDRTKLIKLQLLELGLRLNYQVWANRLTQEDIDMIEIPEGAQYVIREWLYDVHWFEENGHYSVTRMPLVAECEWQKSTIWDTKNTYSAVRFDFQKLIVSNADLRLMAFKISHWENIREELTQYFENTIQNYSSLRKGDKFLFIAFINKEKTFYYKEIVRV